jgi:hypothetical protein
MLIPIAQKAKENPNAPLSPEDTETIKKVEQTMKSIDEHYTKANSALDEFNATSEK